MERYLIVRADANTVIGTGHLMRCLALAQGWRDQSRPAMFVTACPSDGLRRRLVDEGFEVAFLERAHPDHDDWKMTCRVLEAHPDAWVVLDGYHFDAEYQRWIKKSGHSLLVIDDMAHLDRYYADILLNQNVGAEQLFYSCEPCTRFLLGTRYALLRRDFLSWRGWKREPAAAARRILVTLGGSDPQNQTLKAVKALHRLEIDGLEAVVVVGASNPHYDELRAAVKNGRCAIRLVQDVHHMAELMAWADLAISAGGSTCLETTFMGLPTLILVLAENQQRTAQGLDELGVALNLGRYNEVSEIDLAEALRALISNPARCRAISAAGQALVDGRGLDRVLSNLVEIGTQPSPTDSFVVRRAGLDDAQLIWEWANDPSVRVNSFHSEAIPLSDHLQWYYGKLTSEDTRIWILELNQTPVALIRYERTDKHTAEISFSVAASYRGKRLGTRALEQTADMACRELQVKCLKGVVFSSNQASQGAFMKAGFDLTGEEKINDRLCQVFVRGCS
jgi:UDP-2,4-diacetamido-2,4,6-trideoxy-beta-L-altropyranose hydrolase